MPAHIPSDRDPLADHRCLPRDSVDHLVASWAGARGDLDLSPVEVISRLGRVRGHIDREIEALFALHGQALYDTAARMVEDGTGGRHRS